MRGESSGCQGGTDGRTDGQMGVHWVLRAGYTEYQRWVQGAPPVHGWGGWGDAGDGWGAPGYRGGAAGRKGLPGDRGGGFRSFPGPWSGDTGDGCRGKPGGTRVPGMQEGGGGPGAGSGNGGGRGGDPRSGGAALPGSRCQIPVRSAASWSCHPAPVPLTRFPVPGSGPGGGAGPGAGSGAGSRCRPPPVRARPAPPHVTRRGGSEQRGPAPQRSGTGSAPLRYRPRLRSAPGPAAPPVSAAPRGPAAGVPPGPPPASNAGVPPPVLRRPRGHRGEAEGGGGPGRARASVTFSRYRQQGGDAPGLGRGTPAGGQARGGPWGGIRLRAPSNPPIMDSPNCPLPALSPTSTAKSAPSPNLPPLHPRHLPPPPPTSTFPGPFRPRNLRPPHPRPCDLPRTVPPPRGCPPSGAGGGGTRGRGRGRCARSGAMLARGPRWHGAGSHRRVCRGSRSFCPGSPPPRARVALSPSPRCPALSVVLPRAAPPPARRGRP